MTTRREFLKAAAASGGFLTLQSFLSERAMAAGRFPAGVWAGNYPSFCHDKVREHAAVPKVLPSRKVEVCVVGGGLAGLSAAYKLRDSSVLVLEHLDRIGGHAVRDRWNGIWYSGAAAYFVEPEEPLDALYAELNFPLKQIAEPSDSAILSWNSVTDTFGAGVEKLPYPASVRKDFARARKDFEEVADSDDYPIMPMADTTEASKAYDRMSMADWILKEKKYHPAVKAYLDLYARSAFGAPSTAEISAFAYINFYASEFVPRYTFPGGNALAAELMRDAIDKAGEKRIISGATVIQVAPKGEGGVVTYLDRNGRAAAVEAKVVLVACPKYVAKYLVKGLGKEQVSAMSELRYGSYLVANVACTSPISQTSYDTWTDTAPFTDFIVADWIARGEDGKATSTSQVLTVYYPIGYDSEELLDDSSYDRYRMAVVDSLDAFFPGAAGKIEDVRLYRWGHALCHAGPGWYVNKAHVASRDLGRILFCHSDNQGLPAFESALGEGLTSAEKARELLGKAG